MLSREVLIWKAFRAIDTGTTCTIAVEKITALDHEVFDHTMESTVLVALRSAKVILGLACAVLSEILCSPRYDVCEELHFHAS